MPKLILSKIKEISGGLALTISGQEQPLLISHEAATRHRLIEGIVITEGQLRTLHLDSQRFLCERKVGDLLAMRDHSTGELIGKLRRKGFTREIIDPIIGCYRKTGTLDDARFAAAAGQSLLERQPCGRSYLIAYLRKKQIDRRLAEQTAEMLIPSGDNVASAVSALESRWNRISQFELETAQRKAYNYLSRRGFGYAASKAAFDQLWADKNEE
ncbi:MAG TPA: regulatory protein RecX [candidate division Zixibacteria bacterium]|nr:regulatory protein RecX [candidate division Zixibacteria bacterium]